jgi:hypothetical protein
MLFKKQGLIFRPDLKTNIAQKRVMVACPLKIDDRRLRLYCGFANQDNVMRASFIDVDINDPSKLLDFQDQAALDIGAPGMFDDNGLCPSSIIRHAGKIYMFYFAFQLTVKVPYLTFSGLAVSEDEGLTFKRLTVTPVLDRTHTEPLMRSAPCVWYDEQAKLFKIVYSSASSFKKIASGKLLQRYELFYQESKDFRYWSDSGKLIITHSNEDEFGFGRPFYFKYNNKHLLFYSIRTQSSGYSLGYASTEDFESWHRHDNLRGLNPGPQSWDNQNLSYPTLYQHRDKVYLFYCGNNLGDSGLGYATLC